MPPSAVVQEILRLQLSICSAVPDLFIRKRRREHYLGSVSEQARSAHAAERTGVVEVINVNCLDLVDLRKLLVVAAPPLECGDAIGGRHHRSSVQEEVR